MRHSVAGRSTVVGTTLRAMFSLFATANNKLVLREIGVSNTTDIAVAVSLIRFSAATNVGAGLTEAPWDPDAPTIGTAFAGHTGDGTTSGGPFRQASLAAAIGSAYIWTFGVEGLIIPKGTANGLGVICPVGTGQICDFYMDWDE